MVVLGPIRNPDDMPAVRRPGVREVRFDWECAYCGSMLRGDVAKCPNCGALRVAGGDQLRGVVVSEGMTAREFERAMAKLRTAVFVRGIGR